LPRCKICYAEAECKMTIYTFPNEKPTSQTVELMTNTRTFQSPITNATQTLSRKGSYWRMRMTFSNITGDKRGVLQGFFAKLNGQEHRARIADYGYVKRGTASGTATINGAGQTGSTVNISGLSGSLKAGDYISFSNELHMVTADVAGSGAVPISPPIRKATTNLATVDVSSPVGVFILENGPSWSTSGLNVSNMTVNLIEDVLA